jgi:hypothetical protein
MDEHGKYGRATKVGQGQRLYRQKGKEILIRQEKEGWGTNVIGRLSKDLHVASPQMKGFSERNLGYMKAFAQTYPDLTILQDEVDPLLWKPETFGLTPLLLIRNRADVAE